MHKIFLLIGSLIGIYNVLNAQKLNINKDPYPYNNPVITHMYTADASPHVMPDGRVWMVTSVDHEDGGGYSNMHSYHTFSTSDMVNWTDHGEILNIYDVMGQDREPENENWALWAPDMIYSDGKYYLYFPVRIVIGKDGGEGKRKVNSYIAVAVSDSPDKPFKVISKKIEGTKGIDPSIFIDDDGEKYLYYGSHFGAKLKNNMVELDGAPLKMDVDDDRFMEAIWMEKKHGKYYISYHTHYDKPIDPYNPDDIQRKKSRLDYAVSDNPLGPFQYKGILNYELGVNVNEGPRVIDQNFVPWRLYQSNHGGIVEFHGKDYLFYHTSALSSWRQDYFKGPGTWTQRSVCIDEIIYDEIGQLRPVQQTLSGVSKVVVKQPYAIKLFDGSKKLNKNLKPLEFQNIDLGSGYYYARAEFNLVNHPFSIEIRRNSVDGKLLGTLKINKNGIAETFLRDANGLHSIFLVVKNNSGSETLDSFSFLAGAPK